MRSYGPRFARYGSSHPPHSLPPAKPDGHGNQDPREFTAEPAEGTAGAYWAHDTIDGDEVSCDWVVLADGSQWGCVCLPPYVSACCMLRF